MALILESFARLLFSASDKETAFLKEIVEDYPAMRETRTIQEFLFEKAGRALGAKLYFLDLEELVEFAELSIGFAMLRTKRGWLYRLVKQICESEAAEKPYTVTDLLMAVELRIDDEHNTIEFAHDGIREFPLALAEDIRAAVRKHPEILQI